MISEYSDMTGLYRRGASLSSAPAEDDVRPDRQTHEHCSLSLGMLKGLR